MRKDSLSKFKELGHEVAMGRVENVRSARMGGVHVMSSGNTDDISNLTGGNVILPAPAGEDLFIVSSAAGDNTKQMLVELLGADGEYIEPFVVTLDAVNGTTEVQIIDPELNDQFSRVNGLRSISDAGIAGTVTIGKSAGSVFALATPADQISLSGVYTIPAGHSATFAQILLAAIDTSGTDLNITMKVKTKGLTQSLFTLEYNIAVQRSGITTVSLDPAAPVKLEGPLDIKVTGKPSGNQTTGATRITFLIEKT